MLSLSLQQQILSLYQQVMTQAQDLLAQSFNVTDATGSMLVNIQTGTGTVWTDPVVYHNGS